MTQPSDEPRVAIIIPTWNRRFLLEEVLDSLLKQTYPAHLFEVIVIDDASTDSTIEMLYPFRERAPFRMTILWNERNVGAVPARNIAVRSTKAPILAFTDSDCRTTPEWLEAGVRALDENPEAGFVSGPVRNKPGQPVKFFSIGAVGAGGEDPIYPTCNVMYRADAFWYAGAFDEQAYLGNSGGVPVECADADLAWRTKEAGYQNVFAPDMVVYHEVRQGTVGAWLAVQLRFLMLPELLRRHVGLRSRFMWWGPFCLRDNLLFYLLVTSFLLAFVSPWCLLGTVPFLVSMTKALGGPGLPWTWPKLVAQVALLSVRQAIICGSLVCGSFRSRWLAL
ncbi:MAG TPA: glycosyltransferase [Paludibaculum sp.]|jgi:GT2 family glycosyltransferase